MSKYQAEITVIQEAQMAASLAAQKHIDENPGVWYPCGFSWVKIKPARGRLVSALKELGIGQRDDFDGGFRIPNPSKNHTQWMDAKEAGSKAFVDVLKKHYPTLKVFAQTRID